MNLFCVGLSHHTANVEMRERFAGGKETECVLRNSGCAEALVLTTCNRVEVYAASAARISTLDVAGCLNRKIDKHIPDDSIPFYRYEDAQCVRHLFRVASGLDSMVVGETEVLGQAKKAYEAARTSGAAGPYLHRLFQRAFRAAKQVRTRTDITRGAVSVGSVAVDLAARIFWRSAKLQSYRARCGGKQRTHGACSRLARSDRFAREQPLARSRT